MTAIPQTMRAIVMHSPGPASVLRLETRPIPRPSKTQVLIRVHAIGLNRSELFTRQGHSPAVKFPRILGIEATGVVAEAPGGGFEVGEVVATAMGGMGRAFDGGYAEFVVVEGKQVKKLLAGEDEMHSLGLTWEVLGAMPEMFQTAYGCLFRSLRLQKGDRLLIRGGSSSVGLAAATLARNHGAFVAGTARKEGSRSLLEKFGCQQVFIDNGEIQKEVNAGEGFDKVLELVGTTTLKDSLQCAREHGLVCMAGMVGDAWSLKDFSPMDSIPVTVGLTTYSGGEDDVMRTPLDTMVKQVAEGSLKVPLGKTFKLEEMVEAHKCMEENRAGGKIVVLTA